jgi:hypothetical protein
MKNALLLFGPPRTFKKNITNIQEFILKDNQFDIFISTGIEYNEEFNVIQEYINFFKPVNFIITNTKNLHENLLNSVYLKCAAHPNINQFKINMYNGWYKKLLGLNLIKNHQKENLIQYKNILVYRPDVKPLSNIEFNFEIKQNTIYTNYLSSDYGGWVGDLMAFGDFESMSKYLSYYETFDNKFKNKENFHPETSLHEYLVSHKLNLNYYKHECLLVRKDCEFKIF